MPERPFKLIKLKKAPAGSARTFQYPRTKHAGGSPPAGLAGHLFDNAHNAIAPVRQPGAYIRSGKLRSVVESAHGNIARKTKGWVKRELRHTA